MIYTSTFNLVTHDDIARYLLGRIASGELLDERKAVAEAFKWSRGKADPRLIRDVWRQLVSDKSERK